jgi:hypothetical protein
LDIKTLFKDLKVDLNLRRAVIFAALEKQVYLLLLLEFLELHELLEDPKR